MKNLRLITILALLFALGLAGCAPQAELSDAEEEKSESAAEEKKAPAKPKPAAIVLPAGTEIDVRLISGLSSKENTDGDAFDGMAEEDVNVDGKVAIPKDAKITGTVTTAVKSGRFKGRAELWVTLSSVSIKGKRYDLATDIVGQKEGSKAKRNVLFIGGGTGAGAAVGAIAGDSGKDTATGAAIGAAAGTAGALLTGKRDIEFPSESLLRFKLEEAVKIQQ
jgi:hypothetical protein